MYYVCRCEECSFLFTQDAPAETDLTDSCEAPLYLFPVKTDGGRLRRYYRQLSDCLLRQKVKLIVRTSHINGTRLLDVSNDNGSFALFMQRAGWQTSAVTDKELPVQNDGSFDVATLWHSLEGIADLNEVADALYRLLTDNGTLVVAAANCSSFDAAHYGANWAAYDVPRHRWHFTPDTIQKWGQKHGFILTARHPIYADAFYISRLTERYLGHPFASLRGMLIGIATSFSTLARKEQSSSMIYVFRKRQSPEGDNRQ
jgi:SAM-dependent methyltransferase